MNLVTYVSLNADTMCYDVVVVRPYFEVIRSFESKNDAVRFASELNKKNNLV